MKARQQPRRTMISALLTAALSLSLAWAITGNVQVSVTDASGNPIAGASVQLVPKSTGVPGAIVITDSAGVATLTGEEGSATVVVQQDGQTKRVAVVVPGGGTTTATVSMPSGGVPLMHGAPGVGGEVWTVRLKDADLTKAFDKFTLDGSVIGETDGDLEALNEQFDHDIDVWGAGIGATWRFGDDQALGEKGHFAPWISGQLGYIGVEVKFDNKESPEDSTRYDDKGLLLGIGGGTLYTLGNNWYIGAGIEYSRANDIEADREPPVTIGGGGTLQRDLAKIDYTNLKLEFVGGHSCGKGNAWFGFEYYSTELKLDGQVKGKFSKAGMFQIDFTNKMKEDGVRFVGGLDRRFGHTPLFGGVSLSTDGDNSELGTYIYYRF